MFRLSGWLALLLSLTASAAIHQDLHDESLESPAIASAPTTLEGAGFDNVLRRYGIEQNSGKARILSVWFDKVLHDPVIAKRIPGGTRALERDFLDADKREALLSSGPARLTPADRLAYLQLFTRLLDELVPVSCFGLVDIIAVVNHITIAQMSDADTELYLRLLYKVLVSGASDMPVHLPTPEQYTAAVEELSRQIVIELHEDPVDLDRYVSYTTRPSAATASVVCWTTRVTLHAIAKMPEAERDFVVLSAISHPNAASLVKPGDAIKAPFPSSGRPQETTIP
jgi:hypothetical protein